jgi:hypothetical protein
MRGQKGGKGGGGGGAEGHAHEFSEEIAELLMDSHREAEQLGRDLEVRNDLF